MRRNKIHGWTVADPVHPVLSHYADTLLGAVFVWLRLRVVGRRPQNRRAR